MPQRAASPDLWKPLKAICDTPSLRLAGLGAIILGLSLATLLAAGGVLQIPLFWPADAVVVAALLRSPSRRWPALLAAGFVALACAGIVVARTLVIPLELALAHSIEILAAAWAIKRWCGTPLDLSSWRYLAAFVLVSGIAAPLASAVLAVAATGLAGPHDAAVRLATWWGADALGLLILLPTILAFAGPRQPNERIRFPLSTILSLAALAAVTALVFWQSRYPLLFVVPSALLLVAVQVERHAAKVGLLIVTALAVTSTLAGFGPVTLAAGGAAERILILQAFLAVCAVATLTVTALQRRRGRLSDALRAAHDEARTQADRAEAAESAAGVGHWRADLVTGQMTASAQAYEILGIPPGGTIDTRAALAQIHPDDRGVATARYNRAVATGQGWDQGIVRLIRPDGEIAYVSSRGISEQGPDGVVRAVVGTLMDVTRETMAELSLRESEARYRLLAENATDAIIRTGLDGTLLYASAAVRRLSGFRSEDLLGRRIETFVHPDDVPRLTAAYQLVASGETDRSVPVEYRVRHRSGAWMWVECNPTLVRTECGKPREIVDVVRDVTDRKALEAELRAARDAAEEAAAVKAEFMANMSHELRTPLTSILGFARIIAEQPDLAPLVRNYVGRVISAGDALLCTVNDILDFSKLEAGQVEIRCQTLAVEPLVWSALEMFTPQAAAKDVALEFRGGIPAGLAVSADPDRLRQVLLNLIGNAVKFTDSGRVTVAARHEDDRLRIEVADSGPGVSADKLPLLFRRFSQVNGSRTRSHGGTGLGLAICKGLVEAMGGRIGVDSHAGQGSRFWFSIPAPVVETLCEDAPATVAAEVERPDQLRVLVADDHAANRELARLFLDALGADVSEATDGLDAVYAAERAAYDVILMDISMPRLDGIGAAQAIRMQKGPNSSTPILAFTAAVDEASLGRLHEFDFAGVVAKPIDPEVLIRSVAAACNPAPVATARLGSSGADVKYNLS